MSGWRDRAKQRVRELAGVTQATQHPEFEAAKAELLSVSAKYHTLMQLSEDVCWIDLNFAGLAVHVKVRSAPADRCFHVIRSFIAEWSAR
jgi:hypothetical protein